MERLDFVDWTSVVVIAHKLYTYDDLYLNVQLVIKIIVYWQAQRETTGNLTKINSVPMWINVFLSDFWGTRQRQSLFEMFIHIPTHWLLGTGKYPLTTQQTCYPL